MLKKQKSFSFLEMTRYNHLNRNHLQCDIILRYKRNSCLLFHNQISVLKTIYVKHLRYALILSFFFACKNKKQFSLINLKKKKKRNIYISF